jgi:hypothetical protein
MLSKLESIMLRIEKFPSLGDIFGENHQVKVEFLDFLEVFSLNNRAILFSFVEFGILQGLINHKVEEEVPIFRRDIYIESIPKYLCEDGFISYSISSNQSIGEDYPKSEKRKDLISNIRICDKNFPVLKFNYPNLDLSCLKKFSIMCDYKINKRRKNNIDLIDYWEKLGQDDEVFIHGDLIPREAFDKI